ncbi:MAG: phosphonate C-P lyase system protein PhnH [Pseudomonadota bacterium]
MSLALAGGFSDPATGAARAFRAALNAMSRPGRIETVEDISAPDGLSPAAATVLLTLCDGGTSVYLAGASDCDAVRKWLAFHTGAPLSHAGQAAFAVGQWTDLLPLNRFPLGTPEYPDRSATLIVEMPRIEATGAVLRGPGIEKTASLGLPDAAAFRDNAARFPLGLDFFFAAGHSLAALPRTTRVD